MNSKIKKGYPPYDDDKFYDIDTAASSNDCTGLVPTPPKNEEEAESYSDLLNIPQPNGKINNGFQKIRPQDAENK